VLYLNSMLNRWIRKTIVIGEDIVSVSIDKDIL